MISMLFFLNAYTFSIVAFKRNKVDCYCQLIFSWILFFEIFHDVFQVWSNFNKIFFHWWCFVPNNISFIFNISNAIKITYSYWVVIIFFFLFKNVLNISIDFLFDCFIFFFWSKKISYVFNYVVFRLLLCFFLGLFPPLCTFLINVGSLLSLVILFFKKTHYFVFTPLPVFYRFSNVTNQPIVVCVFCECSLLHHF